MTDLTRRLQMLPLLLTRLTPLTRRRLVACLTLAAGSALWVAGAATAQPAPTPAPAVEQAPALPPFALEAAKKLAAGDVAGALALLEPARSQKGTPGPVLSLLGVVYLEANRAADALAVLGPLVAGQNADPAALYHAGRAALAVGKDTEGEAYLERSASRAPRSEAARLLGLRRASQGRTLDAYRLLRAYLETTPQDLAARQVAAFCALDLERTGEAKALLAGLPTDTPRAQLLAGQLLLLDGDVAGALAKLQPLAANHPPEIAADLRKYTAEAHLRAGRPADARRLLTGQATDPHTRALLAQALRETGDLAGCLEQVETLAQGVRQNTVSERARVRTAILLEHGRCAAGLGRHDQAVLSLRSAIALAPSEEAAWRALAASLRAQNLSTEAERVEQVIARLAAAPRPDTGSASADAGGIERGFALLGQGETERAIEVLRIEAALAPAGDPRPRLALVWGLLQAGRPALAEAEIAPVLKRSPQSADALHLRGAARLAQKRFAEAEADFRAALAASPEHLPASSDLGVLLLASGRAAEAVPLFERVLRSRPDDEKIQRHLAEARKPASP